MVKGPESLGEGEEKPDFKHSLEDLGMQVAEGLPEGLVPGEINQEKIELLPKRLREVAEQLVIACQKFLTAPMIIDTFKTHEERRDWRKSLEKSENQHDKDLVEYYKGNRLRGNRLAAIYGLLTMVADGLKKDPELAGAEELRTHADVLKGLLMKEVTHPITKEKGLQGRYHELDLEAKKQVMEEVEKTARDVVEMFMGS